MVSFHDLRPRMTAVINNMKMELDSSIKTFYSIFNSFVAIRVSVDDEAEESTIIESF